MTSEKIKKILIVGGGFGGVQTALDLARAKKSEAKIVLMSDKPHFEYHPALYKVATGHSPLEVCIPLQEIFKNTDVEVVSDSLKEVDFEGKVLTGTSGSHYHFDFLVLSLGSETGYFGIPGLEELSFSFKSIEEALRLKRHLHQVFESCRLESNNSKACGAHLLIIGGGASGVELAGELAVYTKELAKRHGFDPSFVTVDLMEAAPRLVPALPEAVAVRIKERLGSLGVNVFLNRAIRKEEIDAALFDDMAVKSKTIIWTAGVTTSRCYERIGDFERDKSGRIIVDKYLQATGFHDVFVTGDAAASPFSGMAQTAMHNGHYVAAAIAQKIAKKSVDSYQPKKPACAIPVGPNWAAVMFGPFKFYGSFGFMIRKIADLRYFLSILPIKKAWTVFRDGGVLSESCPICSKNIE